MTEFDPRMVASRLPLKLIGGAAAAVIAVAVGATFALHPARKAVAQPELSPAQVAALQHAAFTRAEAQPGFARPESVPVKVLSGETFQSAVQRAGVPADEARAAVDMLAEAMDTVHIKAGMAFEAAIAKPRGHRGPARLIGLSLRTSPTSALTLSRTFDGALRLRELEEKTHEETAVVHGEIDGSLYESASALGISQANIAQMVKLLAHKVDFERDLKGGEPFTAVFDREVTENGRTVDNGPLKYVEFKGIKFLRFERDDGDVEYFDEDGKNIKGFLLRTPVDGARMTSTFGMRKHPVLGYTRMHQGIDFGAGTGTPVFAAGDGVVVEARRWGGYGNWLRIRHQNGWETGYGHLSRYAKGLHAGERVKQGEVVAYVGATGLATGPHLHYETWFKGRRVNPVGAKVPQGTVLAGRELARFKAQRTQIYAMLDKSDGGVRKYAAADTGMGLKGQR